MRVRIKTKPEKTHPTASYQTPVHNNKKVKTEGGLCCAGNAIQNYS